ncbi:MAG: UPF0175 family protein [Xenococcaceae cyanobacterium MO_167.B27]|nr:UPF0175 family protein [Xenococcaceae cyanobacterium MO_167.B27]
MTLEITDEFLNSLELPEKIQFQALKKAKEGYVMALLEAGEISSGRAGKILGVSRLEILEMMGRWGISVFDDSQNLEELKQEVEQAESIYETLNQKEWLTEFYQWIDSHKGKNIPVLNDEAMSRENMYPDRW